MLEIVSYRRMVTYECLYRYLRGLYRMDGSRGGLRIEVADDLVWVPDTMLLSIQKHVEAIHYVYPYSLDDLSYGQDYPPHGKLDIYYQMFYGFVNTVRFTLVITDDGSYRLYTSIIDRDDPHIWRFYRMDRL